jgi:hypothetical protein
VQGKKQSKSEPTKELRAPHIVSKIQDKPPFFKNNLSPCQVIDILFFAQSWMVIQHLCG